MKEQIMGVLITYGDVKANLTSEALREQLADDILKSLKEITYNTPNNMELGKKIRTMIWEWEETNA